MTTPLVTVVMPVYNGAQTINRAIQSLLAQTYQNWNCIIVNDGSTDGTKKYLESLTDPRFNIIHLEKNRGRPYARQLALDNAQGKYLAMLDADDFYHPDKLSIQVKLMEAHPEIALLGCGMCSFGTGVPFIRVRAKGDGTVIQYQKKNSSPVAHAASILRLDRAKEFKYNLLLQLAQDADFLARYLEGMNYMVIEDVLYYYSEFDSASISKFIKSYYYCIIKALKTYKTNPAFATKYLVSHVGKLAAACVIYPFMGVKGVLESRGAAPTAQEQKEYDELLARFSN